MAAGGGLAIRDPLGLAGLLFREAMGSEWWALLRRRRWLVGSLGEFVVGEMKKCAKQLASRLRRDYGLQPYRILSHAGSSEALVSFFAHGDLGGFLAYFQASDIVELKLGGRKDANPDHPNIGPSPPRESLRASLRLHAAHARDCKPNSASSSAMSKEGCPGWAPALLHTPLALAPAGLAAFTPGTPRPLGLMGV